MERTWYLWPPLDMAQAVDEFVVARAGLHITVKLQGGVVILEVPDPAPAAAAGAMDAVAREYTDALSANGLHRRRLTEAEYAALPVHAHQNVFMAGDGRERAEREVERRRMTERAVCEARNALFPGGGAAETLRRSYQYLESARKGLARGQGAEYDAMMFNLYKAVEAIQHAMGGQQAVIDRLQVATELRSVKRLANQPDRDERHAPEPGDILNPPTPAELALAMDHASTVVRVYARSV